MSQADIPKPFSPMLVKDKPGVIGKIIMIIILTLLMLIPLEMVRGIIHERQNRQYDVKQEIANTWSGSQILTGPILAVPYKTTRWVAAPEGETKLQTFVETAYLLPQKYQVQSSMKPETRYRGIYKSVVYASNVSASGEFVLSDLDELKIPKENLLWKDAFVLVSLPEPKGIEKRPELTWNGKALELLPGTHNSALYTNGLYTFASIEPGQQNIPFSFNLSLKGSESLSIVPVGKQNTVKIQSDWTTPSFFGSVLPKARTVSENGFTATWEIPYFAHNYPQAFASVSEKMDIKLQESQVGVSLYTPVDFYQQSERAVKYSVLFLVLTFATYFLFELMAKFRLHPFQYLLVGCALCLFYLLLIALSEVIGFSWSYLVASASIISTITLYSKAIIGKVRKHLQFVIAGLLSVLYGYLYILLQLEDLSLLFGTIGLFIVLGVMMYVTRNIDWYNEQPQSA